MQLDSEKIFQATETLLKKAEDIRIKNRNPALIIFIILAIIGISVLFQAFYFDTIGEEPYLSIGWSIAVFLFCIVGFFVAGYLFFGKIEKIFKNEIIPSIVSHMGEGFKYRVDKEIKEELIIKSRLFRKYYMYGGEHLVTGHLEDHYLEFSNIEMKTRSSNTNNDTSNDSRQKTLFKGIMIHLTLKTKLPEPFWIIPKAGVFRWRFPKLKQLGGGEFVSINGLNSKYEVYTTNAEFTKKLLTGPMTEVVNRIHSEFMSKKITKSPLLFAFIDNDIWLAFKKSTSVFSMPVFPFFYKIDRKEFIDRQLMVINAALKLAEAM